jgi:hypothetical protein
MNALGSEIRAKLVSNIHSAHMMVVFINEVGNWEGFNHIITKDLSHLISA